MCTACDQVSMVIKHRHQSDSRVWRISSRCVTLTGYGDIDVLRKLQSC